MAELTKTIKLHIHTDAHGDNALRELTLKYANACNYISRYVFDHGFPLNFMRVQEAIYHSVRDVCGIKSQMTISAIKTVTARYKTVKEQLSDRPYKYVDEAGQKQYISRTLEWLQKPVCFRRPQADLVRNRDYSFTTDGRLSLNTLAGRISVTYDAPEVFREYFDGTWSLGTAKVVNLLGEWYFHIPATKEVPEEFNPDKVKHVVGIDRGLRFLTAAYDERGKASFVSGRAIMSKRNTYNRVRGELQSKGTKSAKRVLKRISGRENRWMSDINHQISKTLVEKYGTGTLFAVEDLTDVSFDEKNLSQRDDSGRNELRSWSFYQLEQFLTYKAKAIGSEVVSVAADYTSQRCPKCGRIRKENRNHKTHEYVCDCCGYRSNDDRIGAMNIQLLGTLYISGDRHPRIRKSE